uniref:FHF complex subunit HOOK-interacting protein C-terminal domain-containing protein n=1 Tax=Periophthalmus magnuspinnatus TaxID=409849 RepID=A0A3B3Z9D3_9GOBI
MASMVASGNQDGPSVVLKGVDPETCMIVFKNHWAQVVKILEKHDPLRHTSVLTLGSSGRASRCGTIPGDEASAVQNYVEHILFLLMEEDCGQAGAMGPILEFVIMENIMERLFVWSLRREFTDDMKLEQLKMYEMLVGQARQPLLHHKPILRPLMMLLSSCSGTAAPQVEAELVLLLICEDQGATNFLIFSLLIPYIHREGTVGQQARDALLLIMSLSAENQRVAKHIAENTFFCPVLATGLSGLYSSLPTKLDVPNEEWHCLHREDWLRIPALVQFLNSLEFCNAVIQVAHVDVRDQLVSYIYNGFLVPVLAPALHKTTVEEVMTTTAYLELFLRSVSEPALLQTFLSFILLHRYENVHILDTLVSRINTPFQLGTVSLALFRTLIGLYCEDVMLQLVLRYLIPCNHMMLSQRRVVRERDCYSVSAAKILALTPSCCSPDRSPPPLRQLESILFSKGPETPGNEFLNHFSSDDGLGNSCTIGSELYLDVSYLHYLYDARLSISSCLRACQVWSAPYDGLDPPPDQRPAPSADSTAAILELEWDDSYDACPVQNPEATVEEKTVLPEVEPPKHIQEMRRTAIMLVKDSYIEESEFQDDVLVYSLVAKKDSHDVERTQLRISESGASAGVEFKNGVKGSDAKMDGKSGQKNSTSEMAEDLLAQYEDLIRTLDPEVGDRMGGVEAEGEKREDEGGEEEEEMDFSAFTGETLESDTLPFPFGPKPRSGSTSRSPSVPFTGPFISVLLSRLENMLTNPLHVNLLLTGIVAQLAAYPQPLLRSFLLNTNLVFQPTVRSLYQVLAIVKTRIEELTVRRTDFTEMITTAQHWLLARESRATGTTQGPHYVMPMSLDRTDVFATVLFSEFLKELAAIAQEHSILSYIPMEE